MTATVHKEHTDDGPRWRVVDAETGQPLLLASGEPRDGGGYRLPGDAHYHALEANEAEGIPDGDSIDEG